MTKQLNIRGDSRQVFETSPRTGYAFGTRLHVPDGRVFRMSQAGSTTALVAGRTAQAALPNILARDNPVVAWAERLRNIVTIDVGDMASGVRLTPGDYDEGLMYVISGGGAGHVYRISSIATPDLANSQLTITLDVLDLIGFVSTTTRVTLFQNKFRALVIASAPPGAAVLGISPVAVAVDQFFWLQTTGAAAVLQESDLQVNLPIAASLETGGAVRASVVTVPPLSGAHNPHSARSLAAVTTNNPENRGTRLAPVSGLGVVPEVTLGYVIDPGYDNTQCLVHLAVEV